MLGERDAVLGFSLLGIKGLTTEDAEAAVAQLAAWRQDPAVGLILVTAGLAGRVGPALDAMQAAGDLPLILVIPGRQGRAARPLLRDLLRRALGLGL